MSLFGYGFGFSSRATTTSGGGLGFDFSSIGTLEVWLDARDTSSIRFSGFPDNTVDRWDNQLTGKAVTSVSQPSFDNQPSLVSGAVNGNDALRFDGTDLLSSTAGTPVSSTPVYIYVLAQRTGSFAGDMGIVGIWGTGNWDLNLNSSNFVVFDVNGVAVTDTGFAVGTSGASIPWGRQTTTSSQDTGNVGSTTSLATTPISPVTSAFVVGDTVASSPGSGFIGDIVTILVYSALSLPTEHNTVISELVAIGGIP